MSTWVCPRCHTYNSVSSGQCMACGREQGAAGTAARPATGSFPPPPVASVSEVPLARASEPGGEPSFPWLIVAATVLAVMLIAGVVAIALNLSGDDSDTTKVVQRKPMATTVAITSTTTSAPPASIVTTPPTVVPRRTAPRVTTTTLPPVVGNDCPSGSPTDATVHIHTGSTLNFRDQAGSKKSLDKASDGDLVRFWSDRSLLHFDAATMRSWVPAELPNHPGRCGYTSASNINMESDTYASVGYEYSYDCEVWEGGVVAVLLCSQDESGPTMQVIWKAKGSVPDAIGPVARSAAGLATAQVGRDLYTLDIHELRVTRNGTELVTADIRDGG